MSPLCNKTTVETVEHRDTNVCRVCVTKVPSRDMKDRMCISPYPKYGEMHIQFIQ